MIIFFLSGFWGGGQTFQLFYFGNTWNCFSYDFSSLCGELKRKKTWILQVVNTVEEIQERHDAVKEIEKKLLDLHQVCLQENLGLKYLI